jgi:iron complex outermembrane recepter protein
VNKHLASRLIALGLSAALIMPAYAQTGTIRGMVRDARQSPVAGAAVRATGQGGGGAGRVSTGTDGSYVIANLPSGTYTVSASLPGLRTQIQRDVLVTAGGETSVDFVMQAVELEAITVTAMLREQEIAEVPFSIAAPTAQVLRQRGAENIEAIAANVAGFSVQNLGPGQSTVAMRGASSGQIARDQPGVKEEVGAYLDEAPISLSLFTPDLDLFDVTRVEVLRGPQGTLFGSGSLSGTVRYISNQPELGRSSTFGEVGVNAIDGGSVGNTAKLGFNVPLGDKAALRIIGYSNELGGWMDAVQPNFDVNQNVNSGNRSGIRAAFRIAPSSRVSITPRLLFQRVRMDGWNRIDAFNILANPYTTTRPPVILGERQLFTQLEEPFTDEFLLGDVNMRFDVANNVSLTSISSFTNRYILVVRDAGALTSSITGGSIGLSEPIYTLDAPLDDATKSRVFTQELRLAGGQGQLRWLVGGFYSHNTRHYGQDLDVFGFDAAAAPELGAPPGFTQGLRAPMDHLFWSDLDYKLNQTALFGEATLGIGEILSLTGGLRYYSFDEERAQIFDGIFANDNTGTALVTLPGSTNANGVAPRAIASLKLTPALTLNAQVSQGFRLGGINDPINIPLCSQQDSITFSGRDSWTDEKAWNYEVGFKSVLAGGRASFNASAFYMDIRDLQLSVTAGTCSSRLIFNVDKARSQGVELEFSASPNDHFDLSFSAGFNDAKLKSTVLSAGQPVSGMEAGNRLPSVPRVQFSAAATYGWTMGQGSRAFIGGTFQHVGSRFTAIDDHGRGFCFPVDLPNCPLGTVDMERFDSLGGASIGGPLTQRIFTFDPELPSYSLVNVRTGLIRDTWEVAVFINNVTDEVARLALDRERGTGARVGFLTNQPRTLGVSLRFNY